MEDKAYRKLGIAGKIRFVGLVKGILKNNRLVFDEDYTKAFDQILSLVLPVAEKQGIDIAIVAYESTCEALIKEAVEEERKRILKLFELEANELNGAFATDGKTVLNKTLAKNLRKKWQSLQQGGS